MPDNTLSNFTPHGERGGTKDTRMIQRAVRERWPIREQFRAPIVDGQVAIALDTKHTPRDRTRAAECLRRMDHENMLAEGLVSDQPAVEVNVAVDGAVSQTRVEVLKNPEYLEWLRSRIPEQPTVTEPQPTEIKPDEAPDAAL